MYQWPVVDDKLIEAVTSQLQRSISDKGSSGVIKNTEERIAAYYGSKYCLLFSSATGAMHSLVFALNLGPGDSVIAPAYTFFATASPFAYEGVKVLFCDADEFGQMSVEDLRRRYQPGVKAVVCSHMWGVPCDMRPISDFCESKGVSLIEDCSHAHVARYGGAPVGRFGSASVFSTNQKFLTSGEGGFLLTDNRNVYERCLALAHYNERCERELTDPTLRRYALTGLGLKYRAHPLAVAILRDQLDKIEDLIAHRTNNMRQLMAAVDATAQFDNIRPVYDYSPGLYVFPFLARDGATRARFMDYCKNRGATAFDVPESTKPLMEEPLFRDCGRSVYSNGDPIERERSVMEGFPGALDFHSRILKLPLWGHPNDNIEVQAAIEVISQFFG